MFYRACWVVGKNVILSSLGGRVVPWGVLLNTARRRTNTIAEWRDSFSTNAAGKSRTLPALTRSQTLLPLADTYAQLSSDIASVVDAEFVRCAGADERVRVAASRDATRAVRTRTCGRTAARARARSLSLCRGLRLWRFVS